jgi:hypothetical protein
MFILILTWFEIYKNLCSVGISFTNGCFFVQICRGALLLRSWDILSIIFSTPQITQAVRGSPTELLIKLLPGSTALSVYRHTPKHCYPDVTTQEISRHNLEQLYRMSAWGVLPNKSWPISSSTWRPLIVFTPRQILLNGTVICTGDINRAHCTFSNIKYEDDIQIKNYHDFETSLSYSYLIKPSEGPLNLMRLSL